MTRRFLRGVSLAIVPLALAGSSVSYFSKEIRLRLFGTSQERAIAEIGGRNGTYKIDAALPGKPIVRVDLSFTEIMLTASGSLANCPTCSSSIYWRRPLLMTTSCRLAHDRTPLAESDGHPCPGRRADATQGSSFTPEFESRVHAAR